MGKRKMSQLIEEIAKEFDTLMQSGGEVNYEIVRHMKGLWDWKQQIDMTVGTDEEEEAPALQEGDKDQAVRDILSQMGEFASMQGKCGACWGFGGVDDEPCYECKGTGKGTEDASNA